MADWTEVQVQQVWNKGRIVAAMDQNIIRKDACGAWMVRREHGNRNSIYGWEIDHIDPDGGDGLSNLRPLQWKNNVAKSDGRLVCAVTAIGNKNVEA